MVFDRLKTEAVNRAREVSDYASGKSVNAARVAHTLGHPVLATGFAGGARGEALCHDLDAAGIRHDFVTVSRETRQCVTVIDRAAGTATELVEESGPVGPQAWRELEVKLAALLPQANVWIFSGTLAPDGDKNSYARWLPLARQCGARAIIDASGEPLRLSMQHPNAILKVNRDELAGTLKCDLQDEQALLETIMQHSPRNGCIIVTLGASGAVASDGKSCWRVTPPNVATVSAVGSGDAFAAGLAVGLAQNQPLPEALRLAVACGAANVMTPLAGHVERRVVARLSEEVKVERLDGRDPPELRLKE
jgi:tagatose 6-phosphate kinase